MEREKGLAGCKWPEKGNREALQGRKDTIYKTILCVRFRNTVGWQGVGSWESCKSQKTREFVVRLCLLVMSEATWAEQGWDHWKCQWMPKSSQGILNVIQRTTGNWRMLREGRKRTASNYPIPNSHENIHTHNIWAEQVTHIHIYTHIYTIIHMHICMYNMYKSERQGRKGKERCNEDRPLQWPVISYTHSDIFPT